MKKLYSAFIMLFFFFNLSGQTCCSSGVPIASNLGFDTKDKNTLQISLGYEHIRLASLYSGKDLLDDNNRLRITNTILGRIAYSFTDRLSIESLIPYISQQRIITQNNGIQNTDGGRGIGDIVALLQLVLASNQFASFAVGGGIKFPTGANDLTNESGFLLVNDLQLGSASTDYIARISAIRNVTMRPSMNFFLNATALFKGINDSYLGSEKYQFGNEIQANFGYSDQLFFLKTLVYPNASFRLRHALEDRINDNGLENTGGSWIFGRLGIGIDLYKGNRISVTGEYPLFTKVVGTQLSPNFTFNLSYYKAINFSPEL